MHGVMSHYLDIAIIKANLFDRDENQVATENINFKHKIFIHSLLPDFLFAIPTQGFTNLICVCLSVCTAVLFWYYFHTITVTEQKEARLVSSITGIFISM